MGKALDEVEIKEPRIPVFSNVDAKPHGGVSEIKEKLAMQVTQPVQWETIITDMVKSPEWEAGEGNSYELGPGTVCRNCEKIWKEATCSVHPSVDTRLSTRNHVESLTIH